MSKFFWGIFGALVAGGVAIAALAQNPSQPVRLTFTAAYLAGINPNKQTLVADIPNTLTVTSIVGFVEAATGATATATVYDQPNGSTCTTATGTAIGSAMNANGTAATEQVLDVAPYTVAAGHHLCLVTTGTWTSGIGAVTVYANPS